MTETKIDMNRIPQHIAIIMDGNGRWATERGKKRSYGHQAGVESVRKITSECVKLGVKYLTLYTFSTETAPPMRWPHLWALCSRLLRTRYS